MSDARRRLVRFVRREHANERGAALAYRGHARSVRDSVEAAHIRRIEAEEWEHRALLAGLLDDLGARPAGYGPALAAIGWTLGWLCHVTGWLAPMLGAGWIERRNASEYFRAAEDARACGLPEVARLLVRLGAVEVDHHMWFSARVRSHWLGARLPLRPALEIPRA